MLLAGLCHISVVQPPMEARRPALEPARPPEQAHGRRSPRRCRNRQIGVSFGRDFRAPVRHRPAELDGGELAKHSPRRPLPSPALVSVGSAPISPVELHFHAVYFHRWISAVRPPFGPIPPPLDSSRRAGSFSGGLASRRGPERKCLIFGLKPFHRRSAALWPPYGVIEATIALTWMPATFPCP